jgi:hypothetical protein
MGIGILVIGESGSGKSTAMRNLPPKHTAVISVYGKPLPFRDNDLKIIRQSDPKKVLEILQKSQTQIIVIDDFQGLLSNPFMERAKENGFQKFTDIAKDYYDIIRCVDTMPDNCRVYFLSHLEMDGSIEKVKTIGKLLDEKITVEGLFTIVLKAVSKDGKHTFSIRNSGNDTVKTPIDMYPESTKYVANDLNEADKIICAYYGINSKQTEEKQ